MDPAFPPNQSNQTDDTDEFEFVAEPERLDSYLNSSFSDSDPSDGESTCSCSSDDDGPFDNSDDCDDDDRGSLDSIDRLSTGTQERIEDVENEDIFTDDRILGDKFVRMQHQPHVLTYHHQTFATTTTTAALSMYIESVAHARRKRHANHLLNTNPTQVPIICRAAPDSPAGTLSHERMVVPGSLSVNQFCHVLNRKLKFESENKSKRTRKQTRRNHSRASVSVSPPSELAIAIGQNIAQLVLRRRVCIGELYEAAADADGFLYVVYFARDQQDSILEIDGEQFEGAKCAADVEEEDGKDFNSIEQFSDPLSMSNHNNSNDNNNNNNNSNDICTSAAAICFPENETRASTAPTLSLAHGQTVAPEEEEEDIDKEESSPDQLQILQPEQIQKLSSTCRQPEQSSNTLTTADSFIRIEVPLPLPEVEQHSHLRGLSQSASTPALRQSIQPRPRLFGKVMAALGISPTNNDRMKRAAAARSTTSAIHQHQTRERVAETKRNVLDELPARARLLAEQTWVCSHLDPKGLEWHGLVHDDGNVFDKTKKNETFSALAETNIHNSHSASRFSALSDLTQPFSFDTSVRLEQIDRDVPRTYPCVRLFQNAQVKSDLRQMLLAIAAEFPEIGYVQGMNFIAGHLLIHCEHGPAQAFELFRVLMEYPRYQLQDLFCAGLPNLIRYNKIFSDLLLWSSPRLHAHLDAIGLGSLYFSHQWFMTLFAASMPFKALDVLWSEFFRIGWSIIFKVSLAFLLENEDKILECDFEASTRIIRDSPKLASVNLIHRATKVSLPFEPEEWLKWNETNEGAVNDSCSTAAEVADEVSGTVTCDNDPCDAISAGSIDDAVCGNVSPHASGAVADDLGCAVPAAGSTGSVDPAIAVSIANIAPADVGARSCTECNGNIGVGRNRRNGEVWEQDVEHSDGIAFAHPDNKRRYEAHRTILLTHISKIVCDGCLGDKGRECKASYGESSDEIFRNTNHTTDCDLRQGRTNEKKKSGSCEPSESNELPGRLLSSRPKSESYISNLDCESELEDDMNIRKFSVDLKTSSAYVKDVSGCGTNGQVSESKEGGEELRLEVTAPPNFPKRRAFSRGWFR